MSEQSLLNVLKRHARIRESVSCFACQCRASFLCCRSRFELGDLNALHRAEISCGFGQMGGIRLGLAVGGLTGIR